MAQILLKIINTAFTQGKTPVEWSKDLITPVHKKGDKLDPANYRAITLLSVPAKVFCRMVQLKSIYRKSSVDSGAPEEPLMLFSLSGKCWRRPKRDTSPSIGILWTSKQHSILSGGMLYGSAFFQ